MISVHARQKFGGQLYRTPFQFSLYAYPRQKGSIADSIRKLARYGLYVESKSPLFHLLHIYFHVHLIDCPANIFFLPPMLQSGIKLTSVQFDHFAGLNSGRFTDWATAVAAGSRVLKLLKTQLQFKLPDKTFYLSHSQCNHANALDCATVMYPTLSLRCALGISSSNLLMKR